MRQLERSIVHDTITFFPDTPAIVDILHIHEELLVKTADRMPERARSEQAATRDPGNVPDGFVMRRPSFLKTETAREQSDAVATRP